MTLNRVVLGCAVTVMKYAASVVSLMFLPNIFIWNKITFQPSNSLNLAKLVVNELTKSIQKNLPAFLFLSDLSLINVRIARVYNKRTRQIYKNPHQFNILLIMNHQSSSF